MHEMGEMKRAQELRVDEFSVQKMGESHETIQRLTSGFAPRKRGRHQNGQKAG